MLAGYVVKALPVSGSKELRAKPASGLAGIGMIKVLRGDWNKAFFKELEAFPPDKDIGHDDIVDTLSDVVEELTDWKTPVKVKRKPRQLG
jgi:predicted phage terminase large subunit-like protein